MFLAETERVCVPSVFSRLAWLWCQPSSAHMSSPSLPGNYSSVPAEPHWLLGETLRVWSSKEGSPVQSFISSLLSVIHPDIFTSQKWFCAAVSEQTTERGDKWRDASQGEYWWCVRKRYCCCQNKQQCYYCDHMGRESPFLCRFCTQCWL